MLLVTGNMACSIYVIFSRSEKPAFVALGAFFLIVMLAVIIANIVKN